MKIFITLIAILFFTELAGAQQEPQRFSRFDPVKIVSAEPCGECHKSEYRVWKSTPHATGFEKLHRKESAEKIAAAMGFKLIKRESLCLQCHYTSQVKREQLRAISGVSCESCHGAARDWVDIHNNYGQFNYETEPADHKAKRIADSKAAGMLRPSELYDVVANCYDCHTVPHEKLVDAGGHAAGSDFELLSWFEKIRHNFLQSFLTGDGTVNAERPIEHKRIMYVVGQTLDLEYSLRGMALATENGIYVKAMKRRVRKAGGELRALTERTDIPEITEILQIQKSTKLTPNNKNALLHAADQIRRQTKSFIQKRDGKALASLDGLILGTEITQPQVEQPVVAASQPEEVISGQTQTERPAVTQPLVTKKEDTTPSSAGTVSNPDSKPRGVIGKPKSRIRPASNYQTIGPANCSCHEHNDEQGWWNNDRHYASADPFFNENPRNLQIAQRYGISADQWLKGTSICMDCHATVVSGKENREVSEGVSCESCHGPAAEYKEPHGEGDKSLGVKRPGYLKALQLGMVELKNLETRAKTCSSCHYITDQRLISSGHKTGQDFDFAGGNTKIKHWQTPLAASERLAAVYHNVLSYKGPTPVFNPPAQTEQRQIIVQLLPGRIDLGEESQPKNLSQIKEANPSEKDSTPDITTLTQPRSAFELSVFPAVYDTTSIEEILLMIKKRLEWLHQKNRKQE